MNLHYTGPFGSFASRRHRYCLCFDPPPLDYLNMSFSIQPTHKTTVVLKEPGDWDEWILIVKALARRGDIERFVDMTTEIEPVEPARPGPPIVSIVKAGAGTIADLSADEKLAYTILREDYKEVLKCPWKLCRHIQSRLATPQHQ